MISVALRSLQIQRKKAKASLAKAESDLARLDAALAALQSVAGQAVAAPKKKRTMSASARRKIAAAQKLRWAKVRAEKKAAGK